MNKPNLIKKKSLPDGSRLRIGIVASEFHEDITERLLDGALATLRACKVEQRNIRIARVPGSFEIPFGCLSLLDPDARRAGPEPRAKHREKRIDAIVALGCIVKGQTNHNVYIAAAVSRGIMNLSLEYHTPIGFGVITADTLPQAEARSKGKTNRGTDAAIAAVSMATT